MKDIKTIKIKITEEAKNNGLILPEKIENGDWIDLRAAEDVHLNYLEHKIIPLGVAMKLPDGFEAHLAPRSSAFKKFGIVMTNSVGIIDNSYCGNDDIWGFSAICLKKEGTDIKCNDRICQFRIIEKQPEIEFLVVDDLKAENRGGFGSTGVK